ncbi:uncharacterized protein [Embiotoca jacksoni]|uniref:uncharacterized protein n=1 Tax=Embiotoca jacksoni TaxID=100190 RepID=UPI0037047498
MVSLLPSPKEQSPHLFLGSWARSRTPLQAERCDTEALAEQLDQQLASVSFGILGKPLGQFSHGTLTPRGEEKSDGDEDGDEDEPGGDVHDDSAGRPGVCAQGSKSSFATLEATGFGGCGSTTLTNTKNSAASIDLAD